MKIETKYNIEDIVYKISKCRKETISRECSFCEGVGRIEGKDATSENCPVCGGSKRKETYGKLEWNIDQEIIILGILYNVFEDNSEEEVCWYMYEEDDYDIRYASVSDLFASSKEAQQECDRRNKKKDKETNNNE